MAFSFRVIVREGIDLAIAHFRHAEILHKKGDMDAAREQLDHASTLFSDMEMTWWSEQAEALQKAVLKKT